MMLNKLQKLKMNKAPGVDLIGTRTPIELSEVISDTDAEIYNKSLCARNIADEWRLANDTAVLIREKFTTVKLQTY